MLSFIKTALAQTKGIVPPDIGDPGYGWPEFNQLIENILDFMLIIAIPLAVVVIIYGGFLFMTSGGSEQRIAKGKQAMLAAIIGLAIVFGSLIIIKLIGLAIGYDFNL